MRFGDAAPGNSGAGYSAWSTRFARPRCRTREARARAGIRSPAYTGCSAAATSARISRSAAAKMPRLAVSLRIWLVPSTRS